jgi:pre-mRNA-splicing helicase BRR2
MQGTSHQHVSDHLSDLVEGVINELEESRCVEVENDMDLSSLNLGMIASYYYVRYTTIELFASSIKQKHRLKPVVDLLSQASEFAELPLRRGEDRALQQLAHHMPQKIDKPDYTSSNTKANLLMQAHLSRVNLTQDLANDQELVVGQSLRLLCSLVDVVSSNCWLKTALAVMELCQMIVQGMWSTSSPLLQLPHITKDIAQRCTAAGIETIFDLLDADDAQRNDLLQLSESQMSDVAAVANRYPALEVEVQVEDAEEIVAEEAAVVTVTLQREMEGTEVTPVSTPFFRRPKEEGWWLVIGDPDTDNLLTIKRVTIGVSSKVQLQFVPPEAGKKKYTLFLMCDSWVGVDQEHEFEVSVGQAMEADE